MKKTKLIISIALLIICFGCKQASNNKATTGSNPVQQAEKAKPAKIKYETVEFLLQQAGSLSGKKVHVSGIIEHVCKHGNNRFKILSTNGSQELKIELGKNFDMVSADIIGNTAMVTGLLTPNKMDAKMVKAWENKMKKNHAGEENTKHYKHELAEIQAIHKQIMSGEIPYYTMYTVQAESYQIQ